MIFFGKKDYFKPDADGSVPVVVFEGKSGTIPVYEVPAAVGRDRSQVDVLIGDATVSRKHLVIDIYENKKLTVTDQGSTVGTIINGEKLEAGYPYYLSDGDKVTIGNLKFTCHINRDKLGKKISLPAFMQKDTTTNTSEMKKEDLNAASEAAQEVPVSESDIVSEPEIALYSQPEPEAEADAEAETEIETDAEAVPDAEADERAALDAEIGAGAVPDAEADAEVIPDAEAAVAEQMPETAMPEEGSGSTITAEELFGEPEEPAPEAEPKPDTIPVDAGRKVAVQGSEHVYRSVPKFVYYSGDNAVETFTINAVPFVIGRANGDYTPQAAGVSRRHCFIDKTGSVYYITDLESTNGVWVNGRRLKPYNRTALVNGDIVGIGDRIYTYEQD